MSPPGGAVRANCGNDHREARRGRRGRGARSREGGRFADGRSRTGHGRAGAGSSRGRARANEDGPAVGTAGPPLRNRGGSSRCTFPPEQAPLSDSSRYCGSDRSPRPIALPPDSPATLPPSSPSCSRRCRSSSSCCFSWSSSCRRSSRSVVRTTIRFRTPGLSLDGVPGFSTQVGPGRSSVASTVRGVPWRTTRSATLPSLPRRASTRSMLFVTALSPTRVMTSPARIPAFSAGRSFEDLQHQGALAVLEPEVLAQRRAQRLDPHAQPPAAGHEHEARAVTGQAEALEALEALEPLEPLQPLEVVGAADDDALLDPLRGLRRLGRLGRFRRSLRLRPRSGA